jgi:hypothetical protein
MHIARQPDGFRIIEEPAVSQLIEAECATWPRLREHWWGIKIRLKFTGHREGAAVGPHRPGWRLFVDDGYAEAEVPRVRIVYLVLGDCLTIAMATIG